MIVYLIHNRVNGKYYVGWTSQTLALRWSQHLYNVKYGGKEHFASAIRFHGKDSFSSETLAVVATEKQAKELEKLWIITLRAYDSTLGYNTTFGGDGVIPTLELRIRRRAYWKARGIGGKNLIDLTGKNFGRLLVLRKGLSSEERGGGNARWICLCICGKEKLVCSSDLRNGSTQSCGCLQKERATGRPRKVNSLCLLSA